MVMLLYIALFALLLPKVFGVCVSENRHTAIACKNVDLSEVNRFQSENKDGVRKITVDKFDQILLPDNAFNYANLGELTVHGQIRTLRSNSLRNLKRLQRLNFDHNAIREIPNDFFEPLEELNHFVISNNQLEDPTWDTFYKLSAIETLDLSCNKIANLKLGVLDEARSVIKLHLNNNSLNTLLLGVFDELINMQVLDMSSNNISSLPLGIFDKPNKIRHLNLSRNAISELSLGILDFLVDLETLSVASNNLAEAPVGIVDNNPKLIELDLSENRHLNEFPSGILDRSPNLKTVKLAGCSLKSIDTELFKENEQLQYVDLSRNKLSQLPGELFDKNTHLTYLNISRNFITNLDGKIFHKTLLKILDISYNEFSEILPDWLNMKTLENLNAAGNKIIYLDPRTFATGGFRMEYLDMRYNRLVFLDGEFFDWVSSLKRLEIGGNPWDCGCLENILELMVERRIKYEMADYFDGKKPVCVVANMHYCSANKNNLTDYYQQYTG